MGGDVLGKWIVVLLLRFAQFIGLIAVLTGVSLYEPLKAYLGEIQMGNPWSWGELARRFACVSGPCWLGICSLIGLQRLIRSIQKETLRRQQFPTEPWLWNPIWASRQIRLENRTMTLILAWVIAFYVLVLIPVGVALAAIKLKVVISLFLGAVGCFLLIFCRILWINWRWNQSELRLETLPGVIGGSFRAVAAIAEAIPSGTLFRIRLRCDATYSQLVRSETVSLTDPIPGQGSASGSRTVTQTIWQSEIVTDQQAPSDRAGVTVLPVDFEIPPDCQPSGTVGSTTYTWFLSIRLKDDRDLRDASFPVPIFHQVM